MYIYIYIYIYSGINKTKQRELELIVSCHKPQPHRKLPLLHQKGWCLSFAMGFPCSNISSN